MELSFTGEHKVSYVMTVKRLKIMGRTSALKYLRECVHAATLTSLLREVCPTQLARLPANKLNYGERVGVYLTPPLSLLGIGFPSLALLTANPERPMLITKFYSKETVQSGKVLRFLKTLSPSLSGSKTYT